MKKINVEVQCLCNRSKEIRGIEYVTLELLNALVKRNVFSYSVSFFDYGHERGNRELLSDYFSRYGLLGSLDICECNDLDYREVIRGWTSDSIPDYTKKSYEEYVNAEADLYFFPQTVTLPGNLVKGKTVVTIHDILHLRSEQARSFHPEAAESTGRIIDYIAKHDDISIVAISQSTKRDLTEYAGIDEKRISVVYEAYNKELFYTDRNEAILSGLGIKKPYILYLGGLDAHKGLEILCEAFDKIDDKNVTLVMAGGRCAWYDIDPVIASMKRHRDVILPGYVSDEEKRVLMSMAEAFVFPSFYEGFGLPVIEAMACGAPVIASDATSLPEVGGDAAVYFQAGDSEVLTDRINMLLSDRDLNGSLRKKSLLRSESFSWDITAMNMEKVFSKL